MPALIGNFKMKTLNIIKKLLISFAIFFNLSHANSFNELLGIKDGGWGEHYNVPRVAVPGLLLTGLIMGNDSRLGNTVWKSIDSMLLGGIATEALKKTFGRVRPESSHEYENQWFQDGNNSFPSGHVSSMSSIVSPFIYEYAEEEPLVHLLWLFPVHQALGRYNDKRHYASDVTVGFLLGALTGYIAHKQETPFMLKWTDKGVYAGLEFNF